MISLPSLCDLGNTLVLSTEISPLPIWLGYLGGERRPRAYLGSCRLKWESWGWELLHNESQVKCSCGPQSHSLDFVEPAKSQVWKSWRENFICWIFERVEMVDLAGLRPVLSSLTVTRTPWLEPALTLRSWNSACSTRMSNSPRIFRPRKWAVL